MSALRVSAFGFVAPIWFFFLSKFIYLIEYICIFFIFMYLFI